MVSLGRRQPVRSAFLARSDAACGVGAALDKDGKSPTLVCTNVGDVVCLGLEQGLGTTHLQSVS